MQHHQQQCHLWRRGIKSHQLLRHHNVSGTRDGQQLCQALHNGKNNHFENRHSPILNPPDEYAVSANTLTFRKEPSQTSDPGKGIISHDHSQKEEFPAPPETLRSPPEPHNPTADTLPSAPAPASESSPLLHRPSSCLPARCTSLRPRPRGTSRCRAPRQL